MSILNVNQIQPVGSGQTVTISAANITASSSAITASSITATSGTLSGISSVSTTNLTVNGNAVASVGALSNRNIIINGAMQVAQRATQVTGNTSGGYLTCDRFRPTISSLGTWTVDQSTDAPNGFSNSLKLTCTTADASPAAGDSALIRYLPEGQDLQHLSFGTADAKSFVVSFWVKSNKTGTASLSIIQIDDSNAFVSPTYTINSADTWEYKTIVVPGNTNNGIDNDNSLGLYIDWYINSGSTYSSGTNRTTWTTYTAADRNASNLGVGGATSDYFAITGVQLEVGTVATPFEHRSYGDELARCQRYCYAAVADGSIDNYAPLANGRFYNTSDAQFNIFFPVTMRHPPTLDSATTAAGTFFYNTGGGFGGVEATTIALNERSYNSATVYAQGASGQTAGNGTTLYSHDAEVAKLIFTAEL
jgi:hypothetical protein